ncbi:uncharacterized protein PG998_002339 [Apiospora kogelbergensis]|uniref:uncharacterized protein n=1 Tax=Apiospora kogelbergensis TaxID=1337665 RepID=UPI0031322EEE
MADSEDNSTGFTVLYQPEREADTTVDIIFVHGLGGHAQETWAELDSLSQELALVMASASDITRPIIRSTATVMFFGTPQKGNTTLVKAVCKAMGLQVDDGLLDALGYSKSDLRHYRSSFAKVWDKHEFKVKVFYEMLISELRADVNIRDDEDRTPLHEASKYGCVVIVSILLQHGAAITAQYKEGQTPLHHASRYGRLDTIVLLIEQGAGDRNLDNYGVMPLVCATGKRHVSIVKLLEKVKDEREESIKAGRQSNNGRNDTNKGRGDDMNNDPDITPGNSSEIKDVASVSSEPSRRVLIEDDPSCNDEPESTADGQSGQSATYQSDDDGQCCSILAWYLQATDRIYTNNFANGLLFSKFHRLTIARMVRDHCDLPTHDEYKYKPKGQEAKNPPISQHMFDVMFNSCDIGCNSHKQSASAKSRTNNEKGSMSTHGREGGEASQAASSQNPSGSSQRRTRQANRKEAVEEARRRAQDNFLEAYQPDQPRPKPPPRRREPPPPKPPSVFDMALAACLCLPFPIIARVSSPSASPDQPSCPYRPGNEPGPSKYTSQRQPKSPGRTKNTAKLGPEPEPDPEPETKPDSELEPKQAESEPTQCRQQDQLKEEEEGKTAVEDDNGNGDADVDDVSMMTGGNTSSTKGEGAEATLAATTWTAVPDSLDSGQPAASAVVVADPSDNEATSSSTSFVSAQHSHLSKPASVLAHSEAGVPLPPPIPQRHEARNCAGGAPCVLSSASDDWLHDPGARWGDHDLTDVRPRKPTRALPPIPRNDGSHYRQNDDAAAVGAPRARPSFELVDSDASSVSSDDDPFTFYQAAWHRLRHPGLEVALDTADALTTVSA